jgi:hypothetical protein
MTTVVYRKTMKVIKINKRKMRFFFLSFSQVNEVLRRINQINYRKKEFDIDCSAK